MPRSSKLFSLLLVIVGIIVLPVALLYTYDDSHLLIGIGLMLLGLLIFCNSAIIVVYRSLVQILSSYDLPSVISALAGVIVGGLIGANHGVGGKYAIELILFGVTFGAAAGLGFGALWNYEEFDRARKFSRLITYLTGVSCTYSIIYMFLEYRFDMKVIGSIISTSLARNAPPDKITDSWILLCPFLYILAVILSAMLARNLNREPLAWLILSSFLPFLAPIILAFLWEGHASMNPYGGALGYFFAICSGKFCSGCGRAVPLSSHAGQHCPFCGGYWSYERTIDRS